jgi:hypothetical protein
LLVAACVACAWVERAPIVPADAGRAGGGRLGILFLALLVVAFAAYLGALVLARRRPPALRPALVAAVVIQLLPLAGPLLLSTDAWAYWEYGRIAAVHDGNPYVDTPSEYPDDPAYDYAGAAWRETTSVYGPAFTLASEPLSRTASPDVAAWTYKALAAACMLVALALAMRTSRRPALACVLVGWNPLLAVHLAGGGHNDAWIAALTLGALTLGAAGRRQLPGVLWAVAIFVKWVPLLFLPLRALESRRTGRRVGHLGFAVTALLLSTLATIRYGTSWVGAFGPLARNVTGESEYAIPHRLQGLGVPEAAAIALAATAFAAFYVRLALRREARLALVGCVLLLTTPYLVPWYLAWVVPLAAAEDDDTAAFLTLALGAYLVPQRVLA